MHNVDNGLHAKATELVKLYDSKVEYHTFLNYVA